VDVWTSGNRVFACHGRYVLRLILIALREDGAVSEFVSDGLGRSLSLPETEAVKLTAEKIVHIVNSEQAEWDEYYESATECMGLVTRR